MSSYIGFVFKFLFEPDSLSAELLERQRAEEEGNSTSNLFIHQQQQQAPANQSAPLAGGELAAAAMQTSDNRAAANSSSTAGGQLISLTIINKSSPHQQWSAAAASSASVQLADWQWLAAHQQQQQPSMVGSHSAARLWPSKCLGFVRLLAMAQSGNGSSTTTTTAAVDGEGAAAAPTGQLGQLSSSSSTSPANSLLVRLGSFAEFEHLIRQQLAGLFNGSSSNNNNSNNNNSRWQRGLRSATGDGPDSFQQALARAELGARPQAGNSLLRLLIRSIADEAGDAQHGFVADQQQQQQQATTPSWTLLSNQNSSADARAGSSPAATATASELLDCYKQLQLAEYYQNYDIFVGLRIASTLTILFVVFILFVIYKTNCRNGERASRSQLRLTSAASGAATSKPSLGQKKERRKRRRQQQRQRPAGRTDASPGRKFDRGKPPPAHAASANQACEAPESVAKTTSRPIEGR